MEKRKLKTGPDYFIPVDDSLYVLTYDTVYKYLTYGVKKYMENSAPDMVK